MNLEILNRISVGRAILMGLVVASIYFFAIFDSGSAQKAAIAADQQQILLVQKQIKENQAKLDRAAIYKKTAAEIGTTINRLLGVIPEHFGIADLMKIVSNEAKTAGTSLFSITPSQPEISRVASEFEELSVKLDMQGSFLQHMVFLSNITKIPQILILRKFNFDLAREAKGEEAPLIHMVAEIVAYRYRGNAEAHKPGGP